MGRNFCFKNISDSTRFGKKTISIFIFLQIEVYRLTGISEDISDLMVVGGLSMWVIIFAQFAISKEVACVGQIEFCWLMEAHLWKKHLKWDGTWKALYLVWTLVIFKSRLASTAGVTCVLSPCSQIQQTASCESSRTGFFFRLSTNLIYSMVLMLLRMPRITSDKNAFLIMIYGWSFSLVLVCNWWWPSCCFMNNGGKTSEWQTICPAVNSSFCSHPSVACKRLRTGRNNSYCTSYSYLTC